MLQERASKGLSNNQSPLTLVSEASDIAWRKISDTNFNSACTAFPGYGWASPVTCCPDGTRDCPNEAMLAAYSSITEPGMTMGAASQAPALTVENVATQIPILLALPGYNFILGNAQQPTLPQDAAIREVGIATNGERLAILAVPDASSQHYTDCSTVVTTIAPGTPTTLPPGVTTTASTGGAGGMSVATAALGVATAALVCH